MNRSQTAIYEHHNHSHGKHLWLWFLLSFLFTSCPYALRAQELNCKVNINTQQIQGTDKSVFENLKQAMEEFMNNRQWTELQFQKNERIQCSLNLTVTKYDKSSGTFTCTAMVQASRPVYNASYSSTLYNLKDDDFSFTYTEFNQLEYNEEIVDNPLTALMAYYAYLFIGLDLDSFSPNGGSEVLQKCMYLVNNCQNFDYSGWKSFDSDRNRYAIINDYLDGGMQPLRQFMYDYYRKGLDEMANNADRGRTEVTTAILQIQKAHQNKPMSLLPQIWTDFKKDEFASIYNGKGTAKEKETIYDFLMGLNASQSVTWEKIKK